MRWRSPTPTRAKSSFTPVQTGLLQRKCVSCGKQASGKGCHECSQKQQLLQRRTTGGAKTLEVPSIIHDVLNSPGQPLDRETRNFMESRFGHDFSQVRLHTNARAAASAQAIDALSYTVGRNVVFAQGQYTPQTNAGKKLLAHELSHVIQQSASVPSTTAPLAIGEAGSKFETEAEQSATRVMNGSTPATMTHHQIAMVQRQTIGSEEPSPLPLQFGRDLELPVASAELTATETPSASNPQLINLAQAFQKFMVANPQAYIEISGYLSGESKYSSAKEDQNRRQILQRFSTVKTALTSLGVPADKIEIQTSPAFSDKRGGVIEVRAYKKRTTLSTLPLLPGSPSSKPKEKQPSSPSPTSQSSTGGGLNLPDLSKYTKFSVKIFGSTQVNFDLPSSVAVTLPINAGVGKQVIMDFKAETSQAFSFSIKVQGLPQVELGASVSVDIGGDQPKGKFEVGATATRQVCRAETVESLRSQMQAKGKELVEAVNAFNAAREADNGSFETYKDVLVKAGKVGGKLKDLYDLREKAMQSCQPVPIGSIKLVGKGEKADSTKPPEKPDLTKPEPLGNTIMLIFERNF